MPRQYSSSVRRQIVARLRSGEPVAALAAEGKTGEEIAAELEVSAATLYNWRRSYDGMDPDAAKECAEAIKAAAIKCRYCGSDL